MTEARIEIDGMSCGHCVAAVKRALDGVAGVDVRSVDVGAARVGYDPAVVGPEAIVSAVEAEGYGARLAGSAS